ncbi:MAG TPA: hypothetical protein VM818_11900 [Vicinamibacterales bacterium]|nr:hypothetical protein [Vicinamibacterales bacterium]
MSGKKPYPRLDLSGATTIPLATRPSKVSSDLLAEPDVSLDDQPARSRKPLMRSTRSGAYRRARQLTRPAEGPQPAAARQVPTHENLGCAPREIRPGPSRA